MHPCESSARLSDCVTTHWYLVHTKPRQEARALDNLQRQGYPCFLPLLPVQVVRRGRLVAAMQPLFSRYLFIQLETGPQARPWAPVRSTLGVARLVTFGQQPARVPDALVQQLQQQVQELHAQPRALFQPGQALRITHGPFAGLECIYQMPNGDERAIVLLHLLQREVRAAVPVGALRKG
jgi:transcriptional antiterminator RfaH